MRSFAQSRRLKPIVDATRVGRAILDRRVPVYAHFGITHRCNLTCRMCGIWRYGNATEELTLPEIREMASRMRRIGVVHLAVGGGEPFFRSDLEEAVDAFVKAGLTLRVLTNGVNVPRERLERCIQAGLKGFAVSLDSLFPARFDYICEREGAWEAAVRTLTTIAELLRGKENLSTINCVVSHLNLEELPDLAEFARELGFAISFLPVELLKDPHDGTRSWETRFVRYQPDMALPLDAQAVGKVAERVDHAYDALLDLRSRGAPILNSAAYLEASRVYLKTGRFPAEGCDAGRMYFSVAPNGEFTICHRALHQHGRILDPGFEAYFRSDTFESLRRKEVGSCEGCMRACWIDTSFMFRTLPALLETARLQVRRRTRHPLTWDQARSWARFDPTGATSRFSKA
jgi:MoaA/NifB/PqqE/SkfB family radical SAM enzyme